MKKKLVKKKKGKVRNLRLFVFLMGIITLIIIALFIHTGAQESQKTASDFFLLRKQTNYPQKKTIQVGWFKIFQPSPTHAPTPIPVSPTPCPGGIHTQTSPKQSVAFAPAPGGGGGGGSHGPGMWIPPTYAPVPVVDPCISPQP